MKKVLSVLLALIMTVTMLAGCQSQPAQNNQELATKTIERYMDALLEFDFKTAAGYSSHPEKILESAPYSNKEDAVLKMLAAMPENVQKYESSITNFAEAVFGLMQDNMAYKITDVEKVGSSYVATLELTSADTEKFDIAELMTTMMAEIDLNNLLTELIEDGTVSENMSQEEIYDVLFPVLFDSMSDAVKELPAETTTKEQTFTVIEVDGEWLIDTSEF